jgi:hypothetical protein
VKNSYIQNILFFLIFLTSIFLVNNEIISHIVWKFPQPFGDYLQQLTWLKCNYDGYDLYNKNSIECTGQVAFNYGKIFLITPYNEKLDSFYRYVLPYILIFIFTYQVMKIIKPLNKATYFLFVLSVINPSTILLMERMNFDIVIFIAIVFIVYNRYFFINYFVLFYLSLIKFFPAILFVNIFLENKIRGIKTIITIIFIIIFLFLVYVMLNLEQYSYLFNNLSVAKAGYHYLFSLNTLPKVLKYLGINYILSILTIYSFFIYGLIKIFKKVNYDYLKYNLDIYSSDTRLFILGGYLSFFCFIIFSNWFYREVFLILTFPLISSICHDYKDKFSRFLLNFIIFRYIFLFVYGYLNINDGINHINDQRIFSYEFISIISIKGMIDFTLMMIIGSLLVFFTNLLLKDLKHKYKDLFNPLK